MNHSITVHFHQLLSMPPVVSRWSNSALHSAAHTHAQMKSAYDAVPRSLHLPVSNTTKLHHHNTDSSMQCVNNCQPWQILANGNSDKCVFCFSWHQDIPSTQSIHTINQSIQNSEVAYVIQTPSRSTRQTLIRLQSKKTDKNLVRSCILCHWRNVDNDLTEVADHQANCSKSVGQQPKKT